MHTRVTLRFRSILFNSCRCFTISFTVDYATKFVQDVSLAILVRQNVYAIRLLLDGCLGNGEGSYGCPPVWLKPRKILLPSPHGSGAWFCIPDHSSPRWKSPPLEPRIYACLPRHEEASQLSAPRPLGPTSDAGPYADCADPEPREHARRSAIALDEQQLREGPRIWHRVGGDAPLAAPWRGPVEAAHRGAAPAVPEEHPAAQDRRGPGRSGRESIRRGTTASSRPSLPRASW